MLDTRGRRLSPLLAGACAALIGCGTAENARPANTPVDSSESRTALQTLSTTPAPAQPTVRPIYRQVQYDIGHIGGSDSASDPAFITYTSPRFEALRFRKNATDRRTVRAWFVPDMGALARPESGASTRRFVLVPWGNRDPVQAELNFLGADDAGSVSWGGTLPSFAGSSIVLRSTGARLDGLVRTSELTYRIRIAADSIHVLEETREQGGDGPPGLAPRFIPPRPDSAGRGGGRGRGLFDEPPQSTSPAIVSVVFFYTRSALAAAGGASAINTDVTNAIDEANLALANSKTGASFRKADVKPTAFADERDIVFDVQGMREGTASVFTQMRAVMQARRAAVVALIIGMSDRPQANCGYTESSSDFAQPGQAAYLAVPYSCMVDKTFSLAHELGHAAGMGHDRSLPGHGGIFAYSWGYRDPAARFRDLMAYSCSTPCKRVLFYSTTDTLYDGSPIGVPSTTPSAADNARTARQTMPLIARWR
jgi:hypothetical protein